MSNNATEKTREKYVCFTFKFDQRPNSWIASTAFVTSQWCFTLSEHTNKKTITVLRFYTNIIYTNR